MANDEFFPLSVNHGQNKILLDVITMTYGLHTQSWIL